MSVSVSYIQWRASNRQAYATVGKYAVTQRAKSQNGS